MGNELRRGAVDLRPSAARYEIPESGLIRMQQVDRPPLVLTGLHVPCACGRPLVGAEYLILGSDDRGNTRGSVFVKGVCLACGVQTAIFAPPALGTEAEEAVKTQQRVVLEVGRIVDDVMRLRGQETKETAA
jgi:hypothetical protein